MHGLPPAKPRVLKAVGGIEWNPSAVLQPDVSACQDFPQQHCREPTPTRGRHQPSVVTGGAQAARRHRLEVAEYPSATSVVDWRWVFSQRVDERVDGAQDLDEAAGLSEIAPD